MAKKTAAATSETNDESLLVTAAKALGTAAGKVARLAGAGTGAGAEPPAVSKKIPKLVKKTKSKLPRKEKKAAKAATAATGAKKITK